MVIKNFMIVIGIALLCSACSSTSNDGSSSRTDVDALSADEITALSDVSGRSIQ